MGGIYQGAAAVTLRQGANSGVRLGTYSWLRGMLKPWLLKDFADHVEVCYNYTRDIRWQA